MLQLKSFFRRNVDKLDKHGSTELMSVAYNGDIVRLKELIKCGADVNKTRNDSGKYNALLWASQQGHVDCIKVLIESDANVNYVGEYGCTALRLAVSNGRKECVKALIEAGANVNQIDNYGYTVLMSASYNGYTEIMKYLINAGANVNYMDKYWNTALIRILDGKTRRRYAICLKILIDAGADIYIINNNGHSVLSKALLNDYTECTSLIIEHIINDLYFLPLSNDVLRLIVEKY